ncbi:MAG TPA: aldolase/citrate lyase family protein, partial [Acidimicrobiales bacterium]
MSVPERYRGRMRALMDGPDGILGCFCLLPSPFAAEVLGRAGFDFVVVDNQHGLAGRTETTAMLLALEATGTPALLRPPVNSPELIGWALDAGAQGVVIPMVSSADDVRAAVAACRYPPGGGR